MIQRLMIILNVKTLHIIVIRGHAPAMLVIQKSAVIQYRQQRIAPVFQLMNQNRLQIRQPVSVEPPESDEKPTIETGVLLQVSLACGGTFRSVVNEMHENPLSFVAKVFYGSAIKCCYRCGCHFLCMDVS